MNIGEQIFEALTDVGTDLVDMAEHQRFAKSPWRKVLSAAACLTVIAGLGAAVWQYLPTLTPHEPEVVEQPEVIEYAAELEEEEEIEKADEPFVWEPESLPFYIYDPDPASDDTPSKVIDPDGNVILEVESGRVQPLTDQATGEYVRILVDHLPEGYGPDANYLDVYSLDGALITEHLMAYGQEILGNIQTVNSYVDGEWVASLYDRSTDTWIRGDLETAYVEGDCIVADPMIGDGPWLFDGAGNLTIMEQPVDTFLLADGKYYVNVIGENGRIGTVDSKGNQLVPCTYTEVNGAYNGYAVYGDENGQYAIDLETGETVFQWPYGILGVWDGYVLVGGEGETLFFLDWNGSGLTEAVGIEVIDDNNDDIPERILTADGNRYVFLNLDGTVQASFVLEGSVSAITSRTAVLFQGYGTDARASLLNLETGEIRDFEKDYYEVYPLWVDEQATGLFYAIYDGGIDLLREDGTVVLENIRDRFDLQGDVTFCTEDGVQGLKKLDGTWLYQEPIE